MTSQSDDFNYPFPPKHHKGYWITAPMTYEEAVQAFHAQSEKDQMMMRNPVGNSPAKTESHDFPFPPKRSMFWENDTSYDVGYDEAVNLFSGQDPTKQSMMANPLMSQAEQGLADRQQEVRDRILQAKEERLSNDTWLPVQAEYPVLIYETQRQMNDESAPDMLFGDESKQKIQSYGYNQPFRGYYSEREGYHMLGEDQFTLSVQEHLSRMRSLASAFSWTGVTKDVYDEMVDKFEANQGGHFTSVLLDEALKEHSTTKVFHNKLKEIISNHLFKNQYSLNESILNESSTELSDSNSGVSLPKFNEDIDIYNGTVLCVHDVWAVKVYADKLEYLNNKIRGTLRYEIQDHFGLDSPDVNHPSPFGNWLNKYELSKGFRSWYILQHYANYAFRPFFTDINFSLELR